MAYIDRDKAIAYVEEQYRLFDNDENKQAIVEGCIEALKFTPTADVVEVVRCKDCGSYNKHYGECTLNGSHFGENGYCCRGTRTPEERKLQIAEHQRFLQTGIHGEIGFVGTQNGLYK